MPSSITVVGQDEFDRRRAPPPARHKPELNSPKSPKPKKSPKKSPKKPRTPKRHHKSTNGDTRPSTLPSYSPGSGTYTHSSASASNQTELRDQSSYPSLPRAARRTTGQTHQTHLSVDSSSSSTRSPSPWSTTSSSGTTSGSTSSRSYASAARAAASRPSTPSASSSTLSATRSDEWSTLSGEWSTASEVDWAEDHWPSPLPTTPRRINASWADVTPRAIRAPALKAEWYTPSTPRGPRPRSASKSASPRKSRPSQTTTPTRTRSSPGSKPSPTKTSLRTYALAASRNSDTEWETDSESVDAHSQANAPEVNDPFLDPSPTPGPHLYLSPSHPASQTATAVRTSQTWPTPTRLSRNALFPHFTAVASSSPARLRYLRHRLVDRNLRTRLSLKYSPYSRNNGYVLTLGRNEGVGGSAWRVSAAILERLREREAKAWVGKERSPDAKAIADIVGKVKSSAVANTNIVAGGSASTPSADAAQRSPPAADATDTEAQPVYSPPASPSPVRKRVSKRLSKRAPTTPAAVAPTQITATGTKVTTNIASSKVNVKRPPAFRPPIPPRSNARPTQPPGQPKPPHTTASGPHFKHDAGPPQPTPPAPPAPVQEVVQPIIETQPGQWQPGWSDPPLFQPAPTTVVLRLGEQGPAFVRNVPQPRSFYPAQHGPHGHLGGGGPWPTPPHGGLPMPTPMTVPVVGQFNPGGFNSGHPPFHPFGGILGAGPDFRNGPTLAPTHWQGGFPQPYPEPMAPHPPPYLHTNLGPHDYAPQYVPPPPPPPASSNHTPNPAPAHYSDDVPQPPRRPSHAGAGSASLYQRTLKSHLRPLPTTDAPSVPLRPNTLSAAADPFTPTRPPLIRRSAPASPTKPTSLGPSVATTSPIAVPVPTRRDPSTTNTQPATTPTPPSTPKPPSTLIDLSDPTTLAAHPGILALIGHAPLSFYWALREAWADKLDIELALLPPSEAVEVAKAVQIFLGFGAGSVVTRMSAMGQSVGVGDTVPAVFWSDEDAYWRVVEVLAAMGLGDDLVEGGGDAEVDGCGELEEDDGEDGEWEDIELGLAEEHARMIATIAEEGSSLGSREGRQEEDIDEADDADEAGNKAEDEVEDILGPTSLTPSSPSIFPSPKHPPKPISHTAHARALAARQAHIASHPTAPSPSPPALAPTATATAHHLARRNAARLRILEDTRLLRLSLASSGDYVGALPLNLGLDVAPLVANRLPRLSIPSPPLAWTYKPGHTRKRARVWRASERRRSRSDSLLGSSSGSRSTDFSVRRPAWPTRLAEPDRPPAPEAVPHSDTALRRVEGVRGAAYADSTGLVVALTRHTGGVRVTVGDEVVQFPEGPYGGTLV